MNFIELINATQKRLREDTTAAVDATKYSTLVAAFVNDAKTIVESAWDWSQNRSIVTIASVIGTDTYTLTGIGEDPEVLGAWNNTLDSRLPKRQEIVWHDRQYAEPALSGAPTWWTYGPGDGTDAEVNIYPTPDAVYDLKFWVHNAQAELVVTTDEMNVPWKPVVLLAVAMLAEEKGETGGTTSARYFKMADTTLSDAIARDAAKSDREIDWNTV